MSGGVAVLVTLVVYKVVLVVIGVVASRVTRDDADFYLGGRRLGPWVAALSASASSSSAWTLLGVSGAAYAWGLSAVWLFPACVGGFLLNWYVLAPALQRLSHDRGALTVIEVLAGPRGTPLRRWIVSVAALIVVLSFTAYVAAQFQGAGKTFQETFGMAAEPAILVGAGIVVLYTLLGGFWAVSISDALQAGAMVLAALLLPTAVVLAVGGPAALVTGIGAVDAEGFGSLTRGMAPAAGVGFVAGLLGIGLGYPGQPHVVNRFMALADTPGALVVARRVAVAWAVLVYAGMLVVGWGGRVLYPVLTDNEVVFVAAANGLLPPVVAGVLLAAVLSAIMSTADSQLLAAASSVTHDLGVGGSGKRLVWSRAVVVAVSVAAVGLAIWGSQDIFNRVLFAWTALGNAFGPLLVVAALTMRRCAPGATLAAILVGFGGSVLAYSFPETKGTVVERVLPFVAGLVIAWAGSRRAPSGP